MTALNVRPSELLDLVEPENRVVASSTFSPSTTIDRAQPKNTFPYSGPPHNQRFDWNAEDGRPIEILKKRWLEGATASMLAAELNQEFRGSGTVTRSSVIGKVHRLGLHHSPGDTGRHRNSGRPKRNQNARQRARRIALKDSRVGAVFGEDYAQIEMPDGDAIPQEQRKTLLELNGHTCRFPFGDPGNPDFFFCGGQTIDPLPYCRMHARIAYRPPEQARARRRSSGHRQAA